MEPRFFVNIILSYIIVYNTYKAAARYNNNLLLLNVFKNH